MIEDQAIIKIIPQDESYRRRVRKLSKAIDREVLHRDGEVFSVVFLNRRFFFFKAVTWITNKDHRQKGYASECLEKIKKRHNLLFARIWTNNKTSYEFAKKNGFKKIGSIPKIGTLLYWKR
ncbi:MAG: hypothetical protein Q8P10_03080 [bacterium]|nr:hypothetical protein [bacterium]